MRFPGSPDTWLGGLRGREVRVLLMVLLLVLLGAEVPQRVLQTLPTGCETSGLLVGRGPHGLFVS